MVEESPFDLLMVKSNILEEHKIRSIATQLLDRTYFLLPTAVKTLRQTLGGRWNSQLAGQWAAASRLQSDARSMASPSMLSSPRRGSRKPPKVVGEAWCHGTGHDRQCPRSHPTCGGPPAVAGTGYRE